MFRQNKLGVIILIITIITISIIGFGIFIKKAPPEEINQNQPPKNGEEIVLKSKIVEEQVIASKGEGFPRFIPQQGVELIIAPYQYTWDMVNQKLLESYGVLVFKYDSENEIKKIDKIEYSYGTACFVSFFEKEGIRDLNNDDIKELIIDVGCRGGRGFSIYAWINNSLELISPIDPKEGDLFGITTDNDFKFVDIDNDGKIEVSFLYRDYVRLGPGVNDIRIDIYKRIYKWDGGEEPYYLWKEEKIGEEKS